MYEYMYICIHKLLTPPTHPRLVTFEADRVGTGGTRNSQKSARFRS